MSKISVCIATYNGEKYIFEQLSSILSQLRESDEIIISDDHSTDLTESVVNSFQDPRIKFFLNDLNKGPVRNFENALTKSSGELIFLADQDDIWEPNKVSVTLNDFNNGFELILTDCRIFDSETKKIINESFFEFNNSKKGIISNLISNSYIGCCMAFTQSVKEKALPFPSNLPMHDSWIGLIGEIYFKVNFNSEKLIKYRKHSANASDTGSGKSKYSLSKKIGFRVSLLYNLIIKRLGFGKN